MSCYLYNLGMLGIKREQASKPILEVFSYLGTKMDLCVKVGERFHSVEPESPCSVMAQEEEEKLWLC